MKRSVVFGLLCLAVFLAAYVGGLLVTVPQAFTNQATYSTVSRTNSSTMTVIPCGGGDSGGGGRPGSPTRG